MLNYQYQDSTSDAVKGADSGVIGDRDETDGMVNLRCFPRDFCWIRESDLLGEGDTSFAADAEAAIIEALLLPGFLEMLDLRDLTFDEDIFSNKHGSHKTAM